MSEGVGAARSTLWARFRGSKAFLPATIAVPTMLFMGGGIGSYAAWDATRIDVPLAVGQELPAGTELLERFGLAVEPVALSDTRLDPACYSISEQSVPAGTRVVPEDTLIALTIEPRSLPMPRVVGKSLADAQSELLTNCLHTEVLNAWCLPARFSGPTESLTSRSLQTETGFTFVASTGRLEHPSLDPSPTWPVCEQRARPATELPAGSTVEVALTVPLTTVPTTEASMLEDALAALRITTDGCVLEPRVTAIFEPDPTALRGISLPPAVEMARWEVVSLKPATTHAVLCGSEVVVEVAWPPTTMPTLLGLNHVGQSVQSDTAATATLKAANLKASCSGSGTVTRQVPEAGTPTPIGTAVTCVAEVVVPSIVGLELATAASALSSAGVTGGCTGLGIVVSQTPQAGSVLTGTQRVTCEAKVPQPVIPFVGGSTAHYANCSEARAAGVAPIYRGEPGYRSGLDRDNDGIACE